MAVPAPGRPSGYTDAARPPGTAGAHAIDVARAIGSQPLRVLDQGIAGTPRTLNNDPADAPLVQGVSSFRQSQPQIATGPKQDKWG